MSYSRIIEETPGAIELDSNGERNSLCITKIFSSPLERAAQTAELIAQELNYPIKNIQLIDALAEWNVGKLQGTCKRLATIIAHKLFGIRNT